MAKSSKKQKAGTTPEAVQGDILGLEDLPRGQVDVFYNTWPSTREGLCHLEPLTADSPEHTECLKQALALGDAIYEAIKGQIMST